MDEPDPAGPGPSPSGEPPATGEDRMPGWVRGFVIAGIVLALVVVVAVLVGGGDHGPGRHLPAGGGDSEIETPGDHAPPDDHG